LTFFGPSATLSSSEEWPAELPTPGRNALSRTRYNFKRRIRRLDDPDVRVRLAAAVHYGGNPEHKRNPGDFGLTPLASPRPDKTLCDTIEVFERSEALRLIRLGVERGLVSERWVGNFPQNIWSVTEGGVPLEAELENRDVGQYHGYPMPETDPFRDIVLAAWREGEG
jgi:hypothetical protein